MVPLWLLSFLFGTSFLKYWLKAENKFITLADFFAEFSLFLLK